MFSSKLATVGRVLSNSTASTSMFMAVRGCASSVPEVKKLGVIGMGLMGASTLWQCVILFVSISRAVLVFTGHGIAQTAAQKGFEVVAVESQQAALDRGMDMITRSLGAMASKLEKAGKPTDVRGVVLVMVGALSACDDRSHVALLCRQAVDVDTVMGRITPATGLDALSDCDFVIEAIIEDVDIKNTLYKELGQLAKPSAVFASNTSSLRISDMTEASGRPDKMVRHPPPNPLVDTIPAP